MKGQQLFYSFLPGVTAVVLTTQPTWAESVNIRELQPVASSSVLSFSTDINRQLPNVARNSIPDVISAGGAITVKPLMSDSMQAITGYTGVPIGEKGIVSTWVAISDSEELGSRIDWASDKQKQSKKVTAFPNALTSPKPVAVKKKPQTKLPRVSQSTQNTDAASLLTQVQFCPQEPDNGKTAFFAYSLIDLKACQKNKSPSNLQAQTRTPTRGKITPIPTPAPTGGVLNQTPTITPAFAGEVQIPDYLNQDPNPLQFPTKPEEVTVRGTQPITLAQALELAKRNNRDLQVSLLQLQRSGYELREAQASLLPNASLTANLARSGQNAIFGEPPIGVNTDATTNFSSQAQLSYDLYTSGRRQATIRGFEERVRSQELDVERQSEEIRLNVSNDYYNLQQGDEAVRINSAAVNNAQASLRDAQALEQAGVGTRFSVLQSQVNLANTQQDLTNAVSQQQIYRRQLVARLNLSQSVNVVAADPVRLAGLWNQSQEQSIILAFQNRPELQQRLAERNYYEQLRRGALAQLGPQLSVVASYSLQDRFSDSRTASDDYSVGLRASLNLYDGGRLRAQADQRKADIAIAETQFAQQRDQIRFQVEQAFSTLRSNLQNVNTATGALEQARESLRLARLRFQAGVGTQTEVIDAETALTRAEGNRVRAILDYNRALASLQRSVTSRALR